jgi:hypothetical protein
MKAESIYAYKQDTKQSIPKLVMQAKNSRKAGNLKVTETSLGGSSVCEMK